MNDLRTALKVVEAKRLIDLSDLNLHSYIDTATPSFRQTPEVFPDILEDIVKNSFKGEIFVCRVAGYSMINAGILDGARLVVRIRPTAEDGDIVVVNLNDELFVKRLKMVDGSIFLKSENEDYEDIDATSLFEMIIWGVVVLIIQTPKKPYIK